MSASTFVYTVVLRPPLLRRMANAALRAIIPAKVERHGAQIVLNPIDPVVSGALTLRVYERLETEFFLAACRPGMTFLDIGANVGYYTALALARTGGNARVVAMEPDPETYQLLLQTVQANGGVGVDCVAQAASDHTGVGILHTSRNNRGDSRLYANDLADGACQVPVVRGDDLLDELGIAGVDLIKIDVQGCEAHAMAGLEKTIRNSPSLTILSEFWPHGIRAAGRDPHAYLAALAGHGMRLFELRKPCRLEPLTDFDDLIRRYPGRNYTNIVAVKDDLPSGITVESQGTRHSNVKMARTESRPCLSSR
jgi:FkbM family methyltransferase